jgi:hypothetical protein
MKKKLNEDQIRNELHEGSAFFRSPAVGVSVPPLAARTPDVASSKSGGAPVPDVPATEPAGSQRPVRPSGSPYARPSVRYESRRVIRRHPFEFYQDQLERLKQLSLEEQLAGGNGSMSEMVRDAVDRYLSEREHQPRAKRGKVRPPGHPDDSTAVRASD